MEVPVSATSEVPKDATKMDTDDATDVNMQEPKGPADTVESATVDGAQDSEEKPVPMDTDAKVVCSPCYRLNFGLLCVDGLLLAACLKSCCSVWLKLCLPMGLYGLLSNFWNQLVLRHCFEIEIGRASCRERVFRAV